MTVRKTQFREKYPDRFLLTTDIKSVQNFLQEHGFIKSDTNLLSLEKPGDGNMNFVLRARLDDDSSFIIKQSRPWVEKFDQIDAPEDRILVEKTYYEILSENKLLNKYSPRMLGVEEESRILVLEDLGEASDLTLIYQLGKNLNEQEVSSCIEYVNQLPKLENLNKMSNNLKMRQLNHQHIFHLPLMNDNGFDLDEIQLGLQSISKVLKSDQELKRKVAELGSVYLGKGDVLVHGDFYPGSILNTEQGIRVIDPEFAFLGPREWDIAVFIAHLCMSHVDIDKVIEIFNEFEQTDKFDMKQFAGFVGTEIIRRIIGLAQLPLTFSLAQKRTLLNIATQWVKTGDIQ